MAATFSKRTASAFLRARVLVDKGSQWMPELGRRVAQEHLKPQWFNVLRIRNEPGPFRGHFDVLVVVSHEKPDDGGVSFVSLYPHGEGVRPPIKVNPPLPEGTHLYLRTDLRFIISIEESRSWRPPSGTVYSISNEDANRIEKYLREDFHADVTRRNKQIKQLYGIGGEDEPSEDWESFSEPYSDNISKMLRRRLKFEFEPMETRDFIESVDLTVWHQTDPLRRIWADYSWPGVQVAVDWAYSLSDVKEFAVHEPQHVRDLDFPVNRPEKGMISLSKIENPHPGDPPPPKERSNDDESDLIDWDESGSFVVMYAAANVGPPEFTPFPQHAAAISQAGDIRIVCFDVCGTLVNRERKLKALLTPLLAESAFAALFTLDDAYQRYIEFEAQQAVINSQATYRALVEATIVEFVSSLGLQPLSRGRMDMILDQAQNFTISDEASHVLRVLKEAGVRIVAAPFIESALFMPFCETFEQQSRISFDAVLAGQSSFGLYDAFPGNEKQPASDDPKPIDIFGELREYGSRALRASFSPQQVLFVTSSGWRCRLATEAGYVTARLANNGGLESRDVVFNIADTEATFNLDGMQDLPNIVAPKEEVSA